MSIAGFDVDRHLTIFSFTANLPKNYMRLEPMLVFWIYLTKLLDAAISPIMRWQPSLRGVGALSSRSPDLHGRQISECRFCKLMDSDVQ
jgi:hypothetical protein